MALIITLAACAPVEEKPIVSAPVIAPVTPTVTPSETPTDTPTGTTAETIADTPTDNTSDNSQPVIEEVAEDKSLALADDEIADTQTTIAQSDILEEVPQAPIEETAEDKIAEIAAPVIVPYDPIKLVGSSLTAIESLFGDADLAFDNGGLTISHYRQDDCLMLVFSEPLNAQRITHISLRHPVIGSTLDEQACHIALGAKKRTD